MMIGWGGERRPGRAPARRAHRAAGLLAGGAAALWAAPGLAQGPGAAPEAGQTRAEQPTVYPDAFFAPFNPVSAEDMVRRVPGFTLDDGLDRRGFAGTAGNVLINGERPTSKTPLSEQLARISARDVARIEVISGGSAGGELRGHALIVDVRLKPRLAGATNTFVAQLGVLQPGGRSSPIFTINSAFRLGEADAGLALQAQPARRGRIEYEKTLDNARGDRLEVGEEYLQGRFYEYKLSGQLAWRPTADDVVNLTFSATPTRDGRHTYSDVFGPSGALLRTEQSLVTGDPALELEAGGDWERRLTAKSSLKLVGLAARRTTGSDERYDSFPAGGPGRSTFIRRDSESGEYIARAAWTYRASPAHRLDFAGEAAFNYLASGLGIEIDTGSGRQAVPLPVADTRVEETRGELSVGDLWRPSADITIEAGLTVEASRIVQSGDAAQERTFTFLKPRMVATWTRTPREQLRFRLERDVAQLDFAEFASAVSLFDGTLDLGNPDLEPERTWLAQLDWERRFGAKGSVTLSAFHEQIEAVQDQVPVAGQFDAPGNLGDGRRIGLRLDLLTPLDGLGLPRAELRVRGLWQDTTVEDPLTGRDRRFSDEAEWSYSVDLRQPAPNLKLAWGLLLERADNQKVFRLRELRTTGWDRPNVDLYVETTAIRGLVIRVTAADVFLPEEVRERRFYAPDRGLDSNLSRIETRRAIGGYGTRSLTVRVAGRF